MYFEIVGSKTVDISNKKQIRTIDIYRSISLIKLNRNWLGVDLGDESIQVIKERMISLDATFEFKSL